MNTIKDREIFSVGTWRGNVKVEATQAMLAEIVTAYTELNAKVPGFAIPLKLGHNKRVGEPAFGYAENIRMSEDGGTLLADFNDVPPEIVERIEKKQYNAVSVEIWPTVTYGGKTYPNVLGGVALLGAEWPAVKGLKPLFMSDGEQPIQLSKEEDDMKTFTETEHQTLQDAAVAQATLAEQGKTAAEKDRADRAEAALAAFKDEAEKAEVTAVIEAAETKGQIVPANKAAVVAMAEAIRLSVDPAKRSEALKTFKNFVEAMPTKVNLTENGQSNSDKAGEGSAAERVDAAAKALVTSKKAADYRTALDMVFAADPELKTAYAEENR